MDNKISFFISFLELSLLIALMTLSEAVIIYITFNSFPLIIFLTPLFLLPLFLCKIAYYSLTIQKKLKYTDYNNLKKMYSIFVNNKTLPLSDVTIDQYAKLHDLKKYLLYVAWLMNPTTKVALALLIIWLIWLFSLLLYGIGGFETILFCICVFFVLLKSAQSFIEVL